MTNNNLFVNRIPVLNMRRDPSHKSELASQMNYGEVYSVIEQQGDWVLLRSGVDGYEGWCQKTAHVPLGDAGLGFFPVSRNPVTEIMTENGYTLNVPAGSFISGEKTSVADAFTKEAIKEFIPDLAMQFIGSPYLWGGKTFMGIDCSGFTQIVMRLHGIFLCRDASQQVNEGSPVDFINEALPGDLAFFGNEEGNIVHTGVMLGNSKIIHASGCVKVDSIDQNGIFDNTENKYSHFLRTIRRMI